MSWYAYPYSVRMTPVQYTNGIIKTKVILRFRLIYCNVDDIKLTTTLTVVLVRFIFKTCIEPGGLF